MRWPALSVTKTSTLTIETSMVSPRVGSACCGGFLSAAMSDNDRTARAPRHHQRMSVLLVRRWLLSARARRAATSALELDQAERVLLGDLVEHAEGDALGAGVGGELELVGHVALP